MAKRLKEKLLDTDKQVDLIAGPGEPNHTHLLHPFSPQIHIVTCPDY